MEVNNSEFWDIAYRGNAPALLGILRRYVRNGTVAQDLLHEVFSIAIDKYESYTGKGSFEGWLYRITVNTALMYLRDERFKQVEACYADSLPADDDDADDEQADDARVVIETAGFTSEELLAAIDRLPEHHKLVFNMYVMDDFSHRQIAAELNISPGTSKSHLARARKKIQQILYDDALNRKKKKDRRWASAFLLLFPAKRHYIDRLFRNGLSDFRIPPTGGTEFLSTALEQHAASVASAAAPSAASTVTQVAFWGGKLSYMAVSCGTAAITGTVCWLSMSVNSPLNMDNDRVNSEVIVNDTLMYPPTLIEKLIEKDTDIFNDRDYNSEDMARPVFTEPVNSDADSSAKRIKAPVVVKKRIIEHQTVVVRDTIFIVE